MTDQEVILWSRLKAKQLGVKFLRQHGIGPYIVDFFCKEKSLVIEIDGSQHVEDESDKTRDEFLESQGFTVLRFWNNEINHNLKEVLERVGQFL